MRPIKPEDNHAFWIKELDWAVLNDERITVDTHNIFFSYEILSSNGADFVLFIPNNLNTKDFKNRCLNRLKTMRDVHRCNYLLLDDLEGYYAET